MKVIEGNNNYLASEDGRIFSVRKQRFLNDFLSGNKSRGKLKADNSYRVVNILIGKKTKHYVHRLIAECFIPNPNNLPQVNHIDGNKENNAVYNLEWVDNQANQQHAFKTGLQKSGVKGIRRAKLTREEAENIRVLNKMGFGQKTLAKMYNMNFGSVNHIVHNRSYKTYQ